MAKKWRDNFADLSVGTVVLTGRSIAFGGGETLVYGAPSPASTVTKNADGTLTASVATDIQLTGNTLDDYAIIVDLKYDKSSPVNADAIRFGLLDAGSATRRYWCEAIYSNTNFYSLAMKRVGATIVSNAGTGEGTEVTVGSNPTAGTVRVFLRKVGNSLWAGYDVGRGFKQLISATDATYAGQHGVPFIQLQSNGWKLAAIELWDAADLDYYETGWDSTSDPAAFARLRKRFDFGAEILNENPANGSWVKQNSSQSSVWGNYSSVAGKFTTGLSASSGTAGIAVYPGYGLVSTRDVTFGFWFKPTVDFASWTGGVGLLQVGNSGTFGEFIRIKRGSATQMFVLYAQQTNGGTGALGQATIEFPWGLAPAANVWHHMAVTIRADGLTEVVLDRMLCRQSASRMTWTGAALHDGHWFESGGGGSDGITFLYDNVSTSRNAQCIMSDLYVVDGAHFPGKTVPAAKTNVLTVTPTVVPANTALVTTLFGALHGNRAGGWQGATHGRLAYIRTDKMLLASPMEFTSGGNSSTATTPGAATGSPWYWDFQVVHRDLDAYIPGAEGMQIDIDGVPRRMQDAGGPVVNYYSGVSLTSWLSSGQTFVAAVPNYNGTNTGSLGAGTVVLSAATIDAWGWAAADLYLEVKSYCLAQGYDFTKIIWGFWNEGNTASFWRTGTGFADPKAAQHALWKSAVDKITANDPSFTGLEILSTTNYDTAWIPSALSFVQANGLASKMPATQNHGYQGLLSTYHAYLVRKTEADRIAAGFTASKPIDLGEECWNITLTQANHTQFPEGDPQYALPCKAIGGAWLGQMLVSMAKSKAWHGGEGITRFTFTNTTEDNPLGTVGNNSFQCSGLAKLDGTPHAPLNVMEIFQKLCIDWPGTTGRVHCTTAWTGTKRLQHLATKYANGDVYVAFVNYEWDKARTGTVNVQLPVGYAGYSVTRYIVDDAHSSQYDTNGASINLYQESAGTLDGTGAISQPIRGHSTILLKISLNAPDLVAPSFLSALVPAAGLTCVINLTESTSPPILPSAGVTGFTLLVNGVPASLSSATRSSATQVTLAVGATIYQTDTVTLSYTPGNVTDSAAPVNAMAAFGAQPVTNDSTQTVPIGPGPGDTTAPLFSSATVPPSGSAVIVNLVETGSLPVQPAASATGFVVMVNGTSTPVASATRTGNAQYTLALTALIHTGEIVTVSYAPVGGGNDVTDAASPANAMASFGAQAATNGSTQPATTPPVEGGAGGGVTFLYVALPLGVNNVTPALLRQNDTAPSRSVQLVDAQGRPIPIPDAATVIYRLRQRGAAGASIVGVGQVISGQLGVLQYDFSVPIPVGAGNYEEEWTVDDGAGQIITFPSDHYIPVQVKARLA